jgi:hypothetical protein
MITMHLHKAGTDYSGYYYYDRRQQPIFMTGNDTSAGRGKIKLLAFVPAGLQSHEVFTVTFSGGQLSGNWQKNDTSAPMAVKATEKTGASVPFDFIYTSGAVKLRPSRDESPSASYDAASVWPGRNTPTALFIKNVINENFDAKGNSTKDIGSLILAQKKEFLNSYLAEHQDVADSLITEYPSAYSLSESQQVLIVYHSPQLLTLASHYYTYTGGAHGNYGTTYTSIDLTSRKKIALSQVLNPAGIKNLKSLLEMQFRNDRGLKSGEPLTEGGLFENTIEPNENFFLTSKGIGFNYMPYEIGPYVLGEIVVFIPFSQLTSYLQPSIKKLTTE